MIDFTPFAGLTQGRSPKVSSLPRCIVRPRQKSERSSSKGMTFSGAVLLGFTIA